MTDHSIRVVQRVMLDESVVYVVQRNFYPSWLDVTRRDTFDEAMVVVTQLRKNITNHDKVVYSE